MKTVKNYHAPKFEFLSSICAKNRINGYGTKSRWGNPRVHLRANGVPLGPNIESNQYKIPCPKIRIFCYSARSSIWAKIEFMAMAPNDVGDPLGSILGPMGSHWGQKMGQNRKNYHALKFEFFFATPGSSIWAKYRIYGYGAKSRWGPHRVHLGANGVPLGKKNGSKPYKITMPQYSNFLLLRGHRFGQKIEFTVMASNHGGEPLRSILGPMGSHWGQKMGQNHKK